MAEATNVGAVSMDLVLNSKAFKQQLNTSVNNAVKSTTQKTQNTAAAAFGKIGKIAAAALSVKAIVNFTKSCLDLGSNLTEVQNVVDVVFGNMSKDIDDFAKSAITNFGLSETLAKRYAGTFGAMATSFNFTTKEAAEMSKTLVGLTGDVASFYNLDPSVAYTKIKSVFTGETESLKDLGVVMTQNALDQYALANAYGKTTSQMTEQEKVALRYAFVQDKLRAATGDFARTSGSWANQTRVLKLQFDSFKASIGQGLIQVFTPAIKVINILMAKLVKLGEMFSNFTAKIFGKQEDQQVSSVSTAMAALSDNTEQVGSSATKTAKEVQKSLLGFDQINKLSAPETSDSGAGGASGIGSAINDNTSQAVEKTTKKASKLSTVFKEIAKSFKEGFKEASFTVNWGSFKKDVASAKTSIKDIFGDAEVQQSASNYFSSITKMFGSFAGFIYTVGANIAQNIMGGFSQYLSKNKGRVKDWFKDMFDIGASISSQFSETFKSLGTIFSAFGSDSGKKFTSGLINAVSSFVGESAMLFAKFASDFVKNFTQPIIDNTEKIKTTFSGLLSFFGTIFNGIGVFFQKVGDGFRQTYDKKISPVFEGMRQGVSDTLGKFLDMWNEKVQPVLDRIGAKISDLWTNYLAPFLVEVGDFFATIYNYFYEFIYKPLKPIIDWIIQNVIPMLVNEFEFLFNVFSAGVKSVLNILKSAIGIITGILDIILGIFTLNFDKVKAGAQKVWDNIKGLFINAFKIITDLFSGVWENIRTHFLNIWDAISNTFTNIFSKIKEKFSDLKNFFSDFMQSIKERFGAIGTAIGDAVGNAFKKVINAVLNFVQNKINGFIKGINLAIGLINKIPGVNLEKIKELEIPKLANGGYVKPNTPQLAMIGDNRHQGEIVAPENKLREAVAAEVTPIINAIYTLINTLVNQKTSTPDDGKDWVFPIYIGGQVVDNYIITAQQRQALRSGGR